MREQQPFQDGMKKTKYIKLFPVIIALILLLCSCSAGVSTSIPNSEATKAIASPEDSFQAPTNVPVSNTETPVTTPAQQTETSELSQSVPLEERLQVFVFDVGQSDCILIKTGQCAMLIDAGDMGQADLILGYLSENGVIKLDYLVATHPHADHIGSMAHVIRTLDSIGTLLMPDVVHTTKTFEDLLDAIEDTDTSVSIPQPGEIFEMGSARIQILAPFNASYNDLNNYSIVLRIDFGQSSFLFTGDAEDISENEQLSNNCNLQADVIKIGHHGSHSSSTQKYIEVVSPSYAVISCGEGNSYGHPDDETLMRLSESGAALYRTDENGTVAFSTDGDSITVSVDRVARSESAAQPATDNAESDTAQYIGNKNSKIFHKPTCGTLPVEKNRVYFSSRDEAVNGQFRACQRCNP